MNLKYQKLADDEIDLREVILTFWKERFIILIITLTFTIGGYIYGTLQPKVYQTTITLRDAAPIAPFEKYRLFLQQQQPSIDISFNEEFKLNLTSLDNLISFAEQNKKLDYFKSYLKKNNIEAKEYFADKFQAVTNKKDKKNQYSFTFSKPFPTEDFLTDYIFYIKQITENEFKKKLTFNIENQIEIYKQNLEIAKKINLENPILKSSLVGSSFMNEPKALFYNGTKVLSGQIIYYEKLLNEIEKFVIEYDLILKSPSKPSLVSKSVIIFITIAFALGLFSSLIFIFLKSWILK